MDVRKRIAELMKAKGLSVYALSQKSDLSQACIANWFNERNYLPGTQALEKVAAAFGISIAELFCADGQKFMPIGPEYAKLLSDWQKLTIEQRAAVKGVIDVLLYKNCN